MRREPRVLGLLKLAGFALMLGCFSPVKSSGEQSGAKFESAHVRFEQNATDGDVEVVFEAVGADEGLARLRVEAPDGRVVADFRAPEASTLGIRSFAFESPEPTDIAGLKAAYPEGVYRFSGATTAGQEFRGASTLSHKLPGVVTLLSPSGEDVAVRGTQIAWKPVSGVAGYILEIEQEDLDLKLMVELPGTQSSFSVPNGFLIPGKEFALEIGSVSENGNASFVETQFRTAKQ